MNISEEIQRLHELHKSGAINDAEFEKAKALAMNNYNESPTERATTHQTIKVDDAPRLVVKGCFWYIIIIAVIAIFGAIVSAIKGH